MDLHNESDDLTWVPVSVNLKNSFKFPSLYDGDKIVKEFGVKMNHKLAT